MAHSPTGSQLPNAEWKKGGEIMGKKDPLSPQHKWQMAKEVAEQFATWAEEWKNKEKIEKDLLEKYSSNKEESEQDNK